MPGRPIPYADLHLHHAGQPVGEAVEGKCRDEADHFLRLALGRLRKAMIGTDWRIGSSVEPSREAGNTAIPTHPADSRSGNARLLKPVEADDSPFLQEGKGQITLGSGLRH